MKVRLVPVFTSLAVLIQLFLPLISAEQLNEFVSYFEPLNYDSNQLQKTHERIRRSVQGHPSDSTLHLDFNAYGREFKLRLKRDKSIFAPDLEVVNSEFDASKLYKGHAEGHHRSHVYGFVHDGLFEGKVRLSDALDDEFHIEPSTDHFDTARDHHSVIFKASDVKYPYKYGSQLDMSEKTKRWMEEARRLPENDLSTREETKNTHRYRRSANDEWAPHLICQIHLQADHRFTENRAGGSKEKALLLMSKHVQAVHDIYRNTPFIVDKKERTGFGFAIKRMLANGTSEQNAAGNPYAAEYIGVEKFLDIISLEETKTSDEGRFCLNHVFTYRDFEDGVLGLAWVGEPAGKAAGGICEIPRKYGDGRVKTLNTGVVTFVNYNKQVPTRVSEVTFAHELGHNFGAKHDTNDCSDADGNYIMFPKATSGNEPNNRKFSKCSIDYISAVIDSKAKNCFRGTNDSICGNQVVEGDEECDCGLNEEECVNQCCHSAGHETLACNLTANATCSPSQGLCCEGGPGNTCKFKTNYTCNSGECINDTLCDGSHAKCPKPVPKMNLTDCDSNKSVCQNGECSGSRCLKYGMSECQCSNTQDQCKLCCMDAGKCTPLNKTTAIDLLPGAPCNNFEGYCDILGKCRGVDSEGPLERIKNLLFGGAAIDNLVDWVKKYWWAAILIGIGLIILMTVFIKICSVATPSSNPNKPKAKTMSLRRNRNAHPNPAFHNEPPPAYDLEMAESGRGR